MAYNEATIRPSDAPNNQALADRGGESADRAQHPSQGQPRHDHRAGATAEGLGSQLGGPPQQHHRRGTAANGTPASGDGGGSSDSGRSKARSQRKREGDAEPPLTPSRRGTAAATAAAAATISGVVSIAAAAATRGRAGGEPSFEGGGGAQPPPPCPVPPHVRPEATPLPALVPPMPLTGIFRAPSCGSTTVAPYIPTPQDCTNGCQRRHPGSCVAGSRATHIEISQLPAPRCLVTFTSSPRPSLYFLCCRYNHGRSCKTRCLPTCRGGVVHRPATRLLVVCGRGEGQVNGERERPYNLRRP